MNMKLLNILIICILIIFSSCNSEKQNEPNKINNSSSNVEIDLDLLNAGDSAVAVADSIMYITEVKNSEPSEAYYMDQWLSGAKIDLLANLIFDAVYSNRLKAYNYISGEEMSISQVKELETEWKREDVGQILFTEDWFFDSKKMQMYKKVNSIMLAYFRYSDDGTLIGNKAGIRVYLNNTKPMRGAQDY